MQDTEHTIPRHDDSLVFRVMFTIIGAAFGCLMGYALRKHLGHHYTMFDKLFLGGFVGACLGFFGSFFFELLG